MLYVAGVQDVFTDQVRSLVTVYGYANTHEVVKKAKKVDKKAELLSTEAYKTKSSSGYGHSDSLSSKMMQLKSSSQSNYKHNEYNHSRNNYDTIRGSYLPPTEYASSPQVHRDYNQSSSYNTRAASTFIPKDQLYSSSSSSSSNGAYKDSRDHYDQRPSSLYNDRGDLIRGGNMRDVRDVRYVQDARDSRDVRGVRDGGRDVRLVREIHDARDILPASLRDVRIVQEVRDSRDYYNQAAAHSRSNHQGGGYKEREGEYRYSYNEYRPSQSYPSRYESEYQDDVYTTNPNYLKPVSVF